MPAIATKPRDLHHRLIGLKSMFTGRLNQQLLQLARFQFIRTTAG